MKQRDRSSAAAGSIPIAINPDRDEPGSRHGLDDLGPQRSVRKPLRLTRTEFQLRHLSVVPHAHLAESELPHPGLRASHRT